MNIVFWTMIGFMSLISLHACRKTYTNITVPYVINPSPTKPAVLELNTSFFLPLPDNSFLISCKAPAYNYLNKEVYLHYDDHFKFIDSVYYTESLFMGKGCLSNGGVFNVNLQTNNNKSIWKYTLLETDYNGRSKDVSGNLLDSINALPVPYFAPNIISLKNGAIVTAISKYGPANLSKIHLMAFTNGIHSKPTWENDSLYEVDGEKGGYLLAMAADGDNFYILCTNTSMETGILRKHDAQGNLIWLKKMPNYYGRKLLVDGENIVVYGNGNWLEVYDSNGNLKGRYDIKKVENLIGDGGNGFVEMHIENVPAPNNKVGFVTTLRKYNSSFELIKQREIGDEFSHNFTIGRLYDGTLVAVISMQVHNKGEVLVFYRLDRELNNYF
jgi:outer membrane protein assembly factor BamB